MAVVNVNHTGITLFKKEKRDAGDGSACSNTQSMVVVGDHAYILKYSNESSDSGNHSAIVYVVKNFTGNTIIHDDPIQILYNNTYKLFQHPNSLAHYNAMFYIANYQKLSNQSDILGFSN